ncbi:hypothetical protein Pmani_037224 [Petrolisthes manimaculis]|uniref:Uncharacterized protein n=1 Tax=Petrolisthes manimaculis TaxID=1843537 RepID=A0AAE1TLD2_9EUCA|nr:hypothetical protein Pmani_037224 [Petrolisthes manimaculis]
MTSTTGANTASADVSEADVLETVAALARNIVRTVAWRASESLRTSPPVPEMGGGGGKDDTRGGVVHC